MSVPVFEPVMVLRPNATSSLTVGSCSWFMVGLALKPTPGSCPLTKLLPVGIGGGGLIPQALQSLDAGCAVAAVE